MKTKSFLFVLFFLTTTIRLFAQETEQFYFDKAAKEYYNGSMGAAKNTINLGLKYYPENERLLKLKKCLAQDPKKPQWDKYFKLKAQYEAEGYKEGQGGDGYVSKVLTDPEGKKHVFVKKSGPKPPPSKPPTDLWDNFNRQERNLLANGFKSGYGEQGDEEKTLTDPNGELHYYFKKKKVKPISIVAGFKKNGQNKVQWSSDLKDNAESIIIIFSNGVKQYTDDVTGRSSYIFESGDKDFDGVECTVTLKVKLKSNVRMTDNPKLTMITHC